MSTNARSELQRRKVLSGIKRLAGSYESWGAGGKCQDSCRSAELEAESSRV